MAIMIRDLFREDRATMSLEIFPPKPGGDIEAMYRVVREMAALSPDFISITYGAGGGTSETTTALAAFVERQGVPALAHLTCVSSTRDLIRDRLDDMRAQGLSNVLALRGDLPEAGHFPLPGQYRYASELVNEIRQRGEFCIGAACYPEGHVEAASQSEDLLRLAEKVNAGCDFLTTQMFFDNNILYRFLYRLLKLKVDVPVLAGIMPVTNKKQIARILKMSGTVLPPRFLAILDRFGDQPTAMKQAGIAYATEQIIDLIANGVNHIHLYTMNKPEIARAIIANLSDILGK